MNAPRELPIPGDAYRDPKAAEIFRAWVIDGGLQVSLQRAFDGPEVWGLLLADITRHAARIYERENVCSAAEARSRIKAMFDAEWDRPTDEGTTTKGVREPSGSQTQ
jgi:hypothetical protein